MMAEAGKGSRQRPTDYSRYRANWDRIFGDVRRLTGTRRAGMPWSKVKHGSSWSVVNDETGDVKGSGMTEKEADALIRALYANTDERMGRRPRGKGGPPDSLNVPYGRETE